ncbi:RsfA family transcriptional regulator [Lentibacillus cibarius]|uniref:RsfA family transcriptional regulator n=1 Tax=Lentibacillus cibarius TaxID=2583219 RepID=A0A549YLN1_9BACI|nr:RsfA family transcriptional regulator [Lentibacillus cibarius]TRM08742.1 RsfA family transcriptional regulator [Lentibacillus cibarius]TRM12799.1 RsfA family transcriptional regulator [Lentibacillus cibarius]
MTKVRQDAWSHEDDLLLAETVLRHIREGSTQLNAFEEVGDKLNRTSAACGFRWNAEIRNKYTDAIELAKRQRKEKKRANAVKAKQPIMHEPQIEEKNKEQVFTETDVEGAKVTAANEEYNTGDREMLTMDSVIQFLKQVKKDYQASNQSKLSAEQLKKENKFLKDKVNELEEQLSSTEKHLESLQEDYQVFMKIIDRARKMTVLDDQGSFQAPSFRMDKNGNLQQVTEEASNQ